MQTQQTDDGQPSNEEISFTQIIDFFVENIRTIYVSTFICTALGVCFLFYNASYEGTIIIKNNIGVDLPMLKRIKQEFPLYAKQTNKEDDFYLKLSKEKFWKENLNPSFAITKEDLKDYKTSEKVDGNLAIVNLILTTKNSDKEKNQLDIKEYFNFFRNSYMKLKLTDLLVTYKSEVQSGKLIIDKKIDDIKNETVYLKSKAKNLEELKIKFPSNTGASINQVLDPKDSASKYLPVSTQLVAIYSELNNLNEQLKRSQDAKDILDIKEKFIIEFENTNRKELSEINKINALFEKFSAELNALEKKGDFKLSTAMSLRIVLKDVNDILTIDKLGFTVVDTSSEYKFNPVAVLIGLFAGLFLGIFVALGSKLIAKYKLEKSNAHAT